MANKKIDFGRQDFIATPSDTLDIKSDPNNIAKNFPNGEVDEVAFRVGGAGDVRFTAADSPDDSYETLTFIDGEWFPVAVKRIWDTGTDATNIYCVACTARG
jgi:hypothetical protein